MSLRQGVFVVGAVVLALMVGGIWLTRSQTPESAGPAAEVAEPVKPAQALLIPGYGGGTRALKSLADELSEDGIRASVVDVGDGEGDLEVYAGDVVAQARSLADRGFDVDLVGYSAGGLTVRAAAAQSPELFRRVVTLASPHQGTNLADLGALVGQCPKACQQLRPDSALLSGLPAQVDHSWLSIWSDTDEVIVPADSSELPGAVVRKIQQHCDGEIRHGEVPFHPQVREDVARFLNSEPLPQSCAA